MPYMVWGQNVGYITTAVSQSVSQGNGEPHTHCAMSTEVKPGMSLCPLGMEPPPERELLCIFGTGDLGRSLGQRLLQTGYRVVYGSRRPHSCGPLPPGAQVMSHTEAAQLAAVVIVCVHREHYDFMEEVAPQLKGKVLVDVSNNSKKGLYPESNAEFLQSLIPAASVVKAFNTVSAWSLQNGPSDAHRQVFLCGDKAEAKQKVRELATRLGLSVLDRGSLSAAREVEDFPLQLFPEWRLPLCIATGLTGFFFFYLLIRDIIYAYVEQDKDISFRIMVSLANKVFPIVSLIMLSLCYLPGVMAAILQLYRGTKYRRFPDWLDHWMLCRKQLGLLALGFAFLHVLYTLLIPIRYYVRYKIREYTVLQIRENKTEVFDTTTAWYTDSYFSVGILGFALYILLGITSLPSVSNALSWREFSFVQSKLGHLTLLLCTLHTYLYGWNRFLNPSTYKWWTPPGYMLCLVVPSVVLVLKLLMVLPCVDRSLGRIRQGWERTGPEGEGTKPLMA
ncbi:metalloreductase STEAP4 isoform X2 [Gadus morhua]|uniref:Metalloreductase STEAP4-like n=1 Tax=Gadus morhua TaxID=8049 RepID=A0A8C5BM14_GADMO|nr:metalloreductase STEAP4-like isoform X1 [Gadus morhua]XP_030226021.1 metalloreductase STEAP4-like isoform X2 [Gadus morhua]